MKLSETTPMQPKHHTLKTLDTHFDKVASGQKLFEARVNDRDYREGDTVELVSVLPAFTMSDRANGCATVYDDDTEPIKFQVGTVLKGPKYGIAEGWCVFSLLPIKKAHPLGMEPVKTAIIATALIAAMVCIPFGLWWGVGQADQRAENCKALGVNCPTEATLMDLGGMAYVEHNPNGTWSVRAEPRDEGNPDHHIKPNVPESDPPYEVAPNDRHVEGKVSGV